MVFCDWLMSTRHGSISLCRKEFYLSASFFKNRIRSTKLPTHCHALHSVPYLITLLAKNRTANPFRSSVINLNLPTILSVHFPSRAFHHPANPWHSCASPPNETPIFRIERYRRIILLCNGSWTHTVMVFFHI